MSVYELHLEKRPRCEHAGENTRLDVVRTSHIQMASSEFLGGGSLNLVRVAWSVSVRRNAPFSTMKAVPTSFPRILARY